MSTVGRSRWIRLYFAATFVACAIFGLATASAQETTTKVQSYRTIGSSMYMANVAVSSDGSTEFLCSWAGNEQFSCIKDTSEGLTVFLTGHGRENPHAETISANGQVLAGQFWRGHVRVFVWSKATGFKDIAEVRDYMSRHVFFVSDDGSVVIWTDKKKLGVGDDFLMRWSKAKGAKDLGALGGSLSVNGVSPDGSVMVGQACSSTCHGFRWTEQGGLQDFPAMDKPLGVSADGTVILGTKADHIIRWTQSGGAQDLGAIQPNGKTVAHAVAGSATAIAGWLETPGTQHSAFIWTQAGGLQNFGSFGGEAAELDGVSADGTAVVGHFVDKTNTKVYFVSDVPSLIAKNQAEMKAEQAQATAQAEAQRRAAAAQAEQQAKTAALAADQQARYDKAMKTGRPAQIYALAGHMEDEGRPDLAANLYQALIDKYPDDPYTAKAIDKQDAARAAAAQQQQQAQDAANQTTANAATAQNVEACIQQCRSTLNSCKSDAQNQHDAAVAKGLVGMISRNTGMMGGASTDSQNANSAKSACDDAYNGCSSSCQQ